MTTRGQISPIGPGSTLQSYYYAWGTFVNDCAELAQRIEATGGTPDVIVGIARGGWFPAAQLAMLFGEDAPLSLRSLHLASYGKTREAGMMAIIHNGIAGAFTPQQSVLVVDDVCETGHSLVKAVALLEAWGAQHIRTAVLMYKPTKSTTGFVPGFWIHETDRWIIYPWEYERWPGNSRSGN